MQCDIKQYWDLSDNDIYAVYDHAAGENFLTGAVYDASLSREMFQLFARQAECFCAVLVNGGNYGFFYLSRFEGATARLHLALPGGEADGLREDVGRRILDWCFSIFEFKSLLAVTPAADAEAARLWSALGAGRLSEVPGLCWLEQKKRSVPGALFLLMREPPLIH